MAPTSMKQGLGPGSAGYDNLDPNLRAIADRIVAESGGRVWISSGWRSTEQQSRMYTAWKNGTYRVPRVAEPGKSQHNYGRAIDFGGDLRLAQQLGRQYGLIFPMDDEPWHGQLGGNVRYANEPSYADLGIQYNLNQTEGKAASPQEVIANRMSAIMSSIGGDHFGSGAMDAVPQQDPWGLSQPGNEIAPQDLDMSAQPYMTAQVPRGRNRGPVPQVDFAPTGKRADLQKYAQSLLPQFGFSEQDFPALVELWNKESQWNPMAQNPTSTAFGIAQFLNGTWQGTGIAKTTNPFQQIMAGLMYIKSRYQNPTNALAFHRRNNWY